MMKRIIAWMICAAALLACVQALAEPNPDSDCAYYPESEAYVGEWVSGDYVLVIAHMADDYNVYNCTVTRYDPDGKTGTRWSYDNCAYDDIGVAMCSVEIGVRQELTFEDGEIVSTELVYDDGAAAFALDEDGRMVWTDCKVAPDEADMAFERRAD